MQRGSTSLWWTMLGASVSLCLCKFFLSRCKCCKDFSGNTAQGEDDRRKRTSYQTQAQTHTLSRSLSHELPSLSSYRAIRDKGFAAGTNSSWLKLSGRSSVGSRFELGYRIFFSCGLPPEQCFQRSPYNVYSCS